MLSVTIPPGEIWLEDKERFIETDRPYTLMLEHSLISISKWEEKFHKPFLDTEVRTVEETEYYIKCMTINKPVPPKVYKIIPNEIIDEINTYIASQRTATKIVKVKKEGQSGGLKKTTPVTSEYIYSLMILYKIPVEFEKWHFSRLMALIELLKQAHEDADPTKKKRKMSSAEIMARNNALNAKRRAKLHTRG